MISNKEAIINRLKEKFGEDTSDDTLSIFEDLSDTFDDYETRTKDSTDWEKKYKDNDEEWRKKYRDRFLNPEKAKELDDEINKDNQPPRKLKFEDLFKSE